MSDPLARPADVYMYEIRPRRLAILTEGPTAEEGALVARHWAHLEALHAAGRLIVAGRVRGTGAEVSGQVVFRAASAAEAEGVMRADPGVAGGVFDARLFPYEVLLGGG